jgi:hypothetical protein
VVTSVEAVITAWKVVGEHVRQQRRPGSSARAVASGAEPIDPKPVGPKIVRVGLGGEQARALIVRYLRDYPDLAGVG